MRYTKEIRRAVSISPTDARIQLAGDYYYAYLEHINGGSWKTIESKFFIRMWLEDFGIWNYWGGTGIVDADKGDNFPNSDVGWINKIQSVYEFTATKTNRKLFGRRFFWNKPYPISLVFFEKGKNTEGKHIHTIHHFPTQTMSKSGQWLDLFRKYWNDHALNRPVGRKFWYESIGTDVNDQSKVISYASKKMNQNYEYGWFPVV